MAKKIGKKLAHLKLKVMGIAALLILSPILFILFVFFMVAGGGGGTAAYQPLGPVASVQKIEEYATAASMMGVPWDLVMLADAIKAENEGKTGIEDHNPILTSLEFLLIREYTDILKDGQWTYSHSTEYGGKSAILSYLDVQETDLDQENTSETLLQKIKDIAGTKTTSTERYTVELILNPNYELVLKDMGINEDDIKKLIEMYKADYIAQLYLSPEQRDHINVIRATYGLYQYTGPEDYDGGYDGVQFLDAQIPVTYYNQKDPLWRYKPYGTDDIGGYACGPTSVSIVVSSLTGTSYDPVYVSEWAYTNGYWCKGSGSYLSLVPGAAKAWSLTCETAGSGESGKITNALKEGKLIIAIMGPGHFTSKGHFIVLRGITDTDRILVADPNSLPRSQQTWDLSTITSEVQKGGNGPFWIIGKP